MSRWPMMLGALAVAALGGTWAARRRLQSALTTHIDRLKRAGLANGVAARAGPQTLDGLPAPVVRYLRLALPSAKRIEEVRIRQTGTLRTDATAPRWMAFDAEQVIVPPATGFVWSARVQVAPLVHVRVRDALIDGKGSGQVSLMSAFTVSTAAGGIEMNSGALHRYLAEAVWYPTALLPQPGLEWTDVDNATALATLTSHGVSVSLEFRFAESGEVTGIYTPARWGTFPRGCKQVAWEGHFRDYREWDGIVVPTEGDVGWYVDDEWRAVWKGVVVDYSPVESP